MYILENKIRWRM